MKFLFLWLACAAAQVYNPNVFKPEGSTTVFPANKLLGPWNSQSPFAWRRAPKFNMQLGQLHKDVLHVEDSYATIESASYRFQALNSVPNTISVDCNGQVVQAVRDSSYGWSLELFHADITSVVQALADPATDKEIVCTWLDETVISPGKDIGLRKAPHIFIQNPEILRSPKPEWGRYDVVTAAGDLLQDMNASALWVGDVNDYDTLIWLLHPQPSSANSLTRMLHQLSLRATAQGKKVLAVAMDQFGSGETGALGSTVDPLIDQVGFFQQALGFTQAYYDQVLAPLHTSSTRLLVVGIEWNSRVAEIFCVQNPGVCDVALFNTMFVNPSTAETQSVCARTDPENGPFIFAPKLHARCVELGYGCTGYFACDPAQYFNGPLILGPLGLDEELCSAYNRSCEGTDSINGPLGLFSDTIQFPAGTVGVNGHTTYGFGEFFMADQVLGTQQAFVIRCGGKFGPSGFGQAAGQNDLFSITQWSEEERLHLNGRNQFDGIGVDPVKVEAACLSVFSNNSQLGQPNTVQMFAATVLANPDEQVPTIWGVLPGALEDPFARSMHDAAVQWLINGTLAQSVNEALVLLASDATLGELVPGVGGVNRFPLMPWQFGPKSILNFAQYMEVESIGQAGGHMGAPMDAYATMALKILKYA